MPTRPNTALAIGATSSLAQTLCRELARRGWGLILAGRDERELEILAGDLTTRYGTPCQIQLLDMSDPRFSASRFIESAGAFRMLVMAAGDMGSGEQDDVTNLAHVAQINYVVPSQLLSVAAETMVEMGGGTLLVIGSVAGDRGRASNYEYGAAKSALAHFASGLRQRYVHRGLQVLTVKPGFVDTPMTWGMHTPLMASRERVAADIIRAIEHHRDTLYTPWFWRYIMQIICAIPEAIFKKTRI